MIELTLSSYWETKMRRCYGELRGKPVTKVPMSYIQKYVGAVRATEFVYRGMVPYQLPGGAIYDGQQISMDDLLQMGVPKILLRWNMDRDLSTLVIK
jgi:hypothetical protein